MGNLFRDVPSSMPAELTEVLATSDSIRIERIVSTGHRSPDGFWYDQDENEWVVILEGAAELLFHGESQPVRLEKGDYMDIPAHRKHRVEWTSPMEATIWLAVFSRTD